MFDMVATTAKKVAGATGFSARTTYMFSDFFQVNPCGWDAGPFRIFAVELSGVVADETVYIFNIVKIKGCIFSTISGMTTGASRPIGRHSYTKIVDAVFFT